MTAEELVELATRMREAQKRYFRTRTRSDLVAAKNLEVEFDKAAVAICTGQETLA